MSDISRSINNNLGLQVNLVPLLVGQRANSGPRLRSRPFEAKISWLLPRVSRSALVDVQVRAADARQHAIEVDQMV